MLTVEEIQTVPIFLSLTTGQQQRLSESAADIHLEPGEFAVPEGGERALYAVISGKIEVIKTIDGIERRLGWRVPGTIFGEVPLALGTLFRAATEHSNHRALCVLSHLRTIRLRLHRPSSQPKWVHSHVSVSVDYRQLLLSRQTLV